MTASTRFVRRVQHIPVPDERTHFAPTRLGDWRKSSLERGHALLRSAFREERRPGLFIFVLDPGRGLVGRMWLAATADVRAGVLGRHEAVDLAVALDAELSLRQVVFLVWVHGGRVHFSAVDLASTNGLVVASGLPVRRFDGDAGVLLRSGPFLLLCAPTGPDQSMPDGFEDAWRQFDADRSLEARGRGWLRRRTSHRPAGLLTSSVYRTEVPLGGATLSDGVLVGRSNRCDFVFDDPLVSRVHAVLLSIDDVPHVIDAGSVNGVWRGAHRVRCEPLAGGAVYTLGEAFFTWRAAP